MESITKIHDLELNDILDVESLQSVIDSFNELTGYGISIADLKGNVLVSAGINRICAEFHRSNPESVKNCVRSDTELSTGVEPGVFKTYKCLNNMWEVVTPLIVGDRHLGNLFLGQFIFEDEIPDYEIFKKQAKTFGFDETDYLKALDEAPRFSWESLNEIMTFYTKLADLISSLSYSNLKNKLALEKQKVIEKALMDQEQFFKMFVEQSNDIIVFLDENGEQKYISPAIEKYTGFTPEELMKSFTDVIHRDDVEKIRKEFRNLVENPEYTKKVEYRHICKDGGYRHFETVARNYLDDPNINGIVANIRDVTDRKKAEKQNALLLEQVQKTEKLESLGILAGGIAHDFNNLLSGIFGYVYLANQSCEDSETSEYLEKTLSIFDRAKSLTQQLLTFSRGGAPVLRTGRLQKTIKDAVSFALSGSNVSASYDVQEDLKLCDFDHNQISQVVENLVINAVHAMKNGGRIHISASNVVIGDGQDLEPGEYIRIDFKDNGPGIKEEVLKNIFDPFFTTKSKGSGLGLSVCFSIIEKHGGTILVESEENTGTTFSIFLPASEEIEIEIEEKYVDEHFGNGRIIIMDDENHLREILSQMLLSMGYEVIATKNGTESLKTVSDQFSSGNTVKAMILDLTVPGDKGGKDIASDISEKYPDIKIFASSGYSEDPVFADPEKFGFVASIRKPFMHKELATMLEKHLG